MPHAEPTSETVHDVLILGAGLSGVYSLYSIRERFPSWRVKVLEAGTDVGGTWYWNSYPGCRIDTESLSYCYSFDKELLEEWSWKEQFATQPDTHAYIKRVAAKHDLYRDVQFNTRIKRATWDEQQRIWTFTDESGNDHKTRFFISCLGFLSSPTLPNIPGIKGFAGKAFHTSRWPADLDMSKDFAGKKIGVIGTGATGIQTITAISKEPSIGSLSVFQRTANWSAPLRNSEITPDQMTKHKTEYNELFQQCAETPSGFLHAADPRKSLECTPEERLELWEKLYNSPGFGKWLGVFSDTYTDREANRLYSDFIASKIRERVLDPATAESLIPKNHGFGTRRVPLESGYFEAFNKPNVNLVDLQKTPIEQVTAAGIRTSDGKEHELDILIFATGFDAITGAFNAIEWHAKDHKPLTSLDSDLSETAIWPGQRPRTFLGLTAPSMPNMFMVLGPHQPFGNATRSIEHAVEVISDLLEYCRDHVYTYVEPEEEAVEAWTDHVVECSKAAVLVNEIDSWMTGINKNVKGKTVRSVVRYSGSAIEYRRRCRECKEKGYDGLAFA
ncbi:2-oxo-Delta(3)-4,5,5-trimethylcyclopentenylacetyl-CoA monooxygenase [Pseudocercospora fuligena]|uniref:2-oxo-Delta(3)-4,5, 5-trimethylcyclopentenylacetyl-CoA monooxygenase n=1 Tax=Pseudocercospora fuligena TaxID=685502 RepID=A0A8H6RC59_9PEZI|nr:2-oxo-Delta(3)-4,5,5-trimethylcyclopentenylacetyl-CoA monooxygenase [Pseudocercospora fuligena]